MLLPVTVLTNTLLTNCGRLAGQLFTGDGFNNGLTLLTNTLLTNGGRLAGQLFVGDGFKDRLCGQHSTLHGVVRALDLRHVHEARAAANQAAPWEGQFGNALKTGQFKVTLLHSDMHFCPCI